MRLKPLSNRDLLFRQPQHHATRTQKFPSAERDYY
jgi:hypothetical protein